MATNNDKIKKIDDDFIKVSEILSGLHVDYHYGDETIIAKHGSVNKNGFQVGNNCYKAVILPSMYTISSSTIELLQKLINNQGIANKCSRNATQNRRQNWSSLRCWNDHQRYCRAS